MSNVATYSVDEGVGVIAIDSPPVNALGIKVRQGLDEGFRSFAADPAVRAVVLICGGRTFFAGADITEFGKPPQEPGLAAVFDIIENGSKLVVAAIHGTALGGGLELALICHYRVPYPRRSSVCRKSTSACCRARAAHSACRASSVSRRRST